MLALVLLCSLSHAIIPVPQRRILAGNLRIEPQKSTNVPGEFSICVSYMLHSDGKVFQLNEQQDFSGACPQSGQVVTGIQDYFAAHCPSGSMCRYHLAKVKAGACANMDNVCYLKSWDTKMLPGGCCMTVKQQLPKGFGNCNDVHAKSKRMFTRTPVKVCSSATKACMNQDGVEVQMTFTGTSCPTFADIKSLAPMTEGACPSIKNDVCYVTKEAEQKGLPSRFPEGCCVSVKRAKPKAGQKTCSQLNPQLTDKNLPFCGGTAVPHVTGQPEVFTTANFNQFIHKEKEDFTPMLITTFSIYAFVMGLIVLFFCTGGCECCKSDDYDSDDESVTNTEEAAKNHKRAMDDFAFRRMSLTGAPEMMSDRRAKH